MIEQTCKVCPKKFMAREADINRGWAKCCSKSCAAKYKNVTKGKKKKPYSVKVHQVFVDKNDTEYHGFDGIDFPDNYVVPQGASECRLNEEEVVIK